MGAVPNDCFEALSSAFQNLFPPSFSSPACLLRRVHLLRLTFSKLVMRNFKTTKQLWLDMENDEPRQLGLERRNARSNDRMALLHAHGNLCEKVSTSLSAMKGMGLSRAFELS
jgi:hypothetical protein